MAIGKWTVEQAMSEMYFFGFNGFWHPSMKKFIREFPNHLHSAPALAPLVQAASHGVNRIVQEATKHLSLLESS
jgi:hypothetical protein